MAFMAWASGIFGTRRTLYRTVQLGMGDFPTGAIGCWRAVTGNRKGQAPDVRVRRRANRLTRRKTSGGHRLLHRGFSVLREQATQEKNVGWVNPKRHPSPLAMAFDGYRLRLNPSYFSALRESA